ncbi:cytochrome p450 domain-containing protein [Phthorimaea operculella]|nr:cytochrome p450 domain-containing protein [Phthorimaea operculella]
MLPDVGNLPVIGHTHWFIGDPERILKNVNTLAEMVDESGGIANVWIGPALYIVTLIPEDVQKILETCLQKDDSYRFLRNWLGDGLFVAPVDLWKVHRRFLAPIFSPKIIEEYLGVFAEQADVLVERLGERSGGKQFDVYPYVTSCMLDIVFETAMGERMDVQHNPDTPYLRARHMVMSIINLRLFKAWLQPDALFNLTPYSKLQKESIHATHKFTDEVVNTKRSMFETNEFNKEGRKDILELMLEKNKDFTNEQLREHIDSITIAGNDTTSLVICYAMMLLGFHKEHQEKVFQELRTIFGDSKRAPNRDDLNKMDYLERVIKETMRLYMVVPIIGRKTDKELKLSTCTVPPGVGLAVIPFVIHRSKRLWGEDADLFNPDRFLPENSLHRHHCAFIPFSHGSRNCIGRHFGMLAMKMILSTVVRNFKITSDLHTCERLKIEILLFPVGGHLLTLEKRATDIRT